MNEKYIRIQTLNVMCLDIMAIGISAMLANYVRHGEIRWKGILISESTIYLYLLLVYILVSFFRNTKQEFFKRGFWAELVDIIKETTAYMAILIATMFGIKTSADFSRLMFAYFYVFMITIKYLFRIGYKANLLRLKKRSFYTKRLVILTIKDNVPEILERLNNESMWEYKLKGLILLDAPDEMIEKEYCGVQVMGNYSTMYDCLTQRVVDEIFIHVPYEAGLHVSKAVERYEDMGLTVNLNVNVFNLNLKHKSKELRPFGEYYAIAFQQSVIDLKMRVVKRTMDIIGGLVGLFFTGIITIFLAPAILIESPGPLFFAQQRVGLNGRKFKFYKFRSMYQDAEERKKELMSQNEMQGLMFKMENDPRITKVGKFIRKTSLDEFPQFWNVLKGDMSLIGTRPPTVDEFEKYKAEYKRRLSIRPGITGMWQVSGRSDITDFEDVLALDLEYIDNWSISLDIKILILTVAGIFIGKGAK